MAQDLDPTLSITYFACKTYYIKGVTLMTLTVNFNTTSSSL